MEGKIRKKDTQSDTCLIYTQSTLPSLLSQYVPL